MEEYISKKEVLTKYGISYGALYRWKRMGLIPEDWFVRKSTQTGQETFFPKQRICERVEEIMALKTESSLEELANRYKTGTERVQLIIRHKSGTGESPTSGESRIDVSDIESLRLSNGADLTQILRELIAKS